MSEIWQGMDNLIISYNPVIDEFNRETFIANHIASSLGFAKL